MAQLSAEIADIAELASVEQLLKHLLQDELPGVTVTTKIPQRKTEKALPMVLVRRYHNALEARGGDSRFLGRCLVSVQTFTHDVAIPGAPSGDLQGSTLSEAVRVRLREATIAKPHFPELGTFIGARLYSPPRRVADWATATGPVQYADLPAGTWRYETVYRISYRPKL